MINTEFFVSALSKQGMDFFVGVPDSLLKDICAFLEDTSEKGKYIIAANEGNALAMAAGYYMATQKIGVVYMQNSGLGNIINPLLSLNDDEVYGIPALLIIGWRGEPGVKDEPQHKKQGKVTLDLLKVCGIEYDLIDRDTSSEELIRIIDESKQAMLSNNKVRALVVRKDTFSPYKSSKEKLSGSGLMKREEAIYCILDHMDRESLIVSTTGKTSRELFEAREQRGESHERDFLVVGSMGHTSSIALGVALNTDQRVYIFDGDGSFIMHMGGAAILGQSEADNIVHLIFNNGAHESVGNQRTIGKEIPIADVARLFGYKYCRKVQNQEQLAVALREVLELRGKALIEIDIAVGSRSDLGRPTLSTFETKDHFMQSI